MRLPLPALLVCTLFALTASAEAQAQAFSSLEERMSGAEYRAAGLDKLSDEELAALNDWIRRSVTPTAPQPGFADRDRDAGRSFLGFGRDEPVVSRISGEFRGWQGANTRFRLDNGQVWESIDPGSRLVVSLTDPEVRVRPGFGGSWFFSVEGYNTEVRVRRVE